MTTDKRSRVQAVDTTFRTLETLQQRGVAGVTELATALDMSKANVHKHLATLCDRGILVRNGEKYQPSLRLFEMGLTVRQRHPLYREAASNIQELSEVTNRTATLLVPDRCTGIYIRSIDPDDRSTPGRMEGVRNPLHRTASGRAILACYSDAERTERLPDTLSEDERERLLDSLAGHSQDETIVSELPQEPDLREIATPIPVDGEPVGAVGLLLDDTVDSNEQVEPSYGQLVKKASTTLSKRMSLRRNTEA